jgi:hypothetical protein
MPGDWIHLFSIDVMEARSPPLEIMFLRLIGGSIAIQLQKQEQNITVQQEQRTSDRKESVLLDACFNNTAFACFLWLESD